MSHPTAGQLPISRELAELLAPRILARTIEEDGCWLRTVCLSSAGYSRISHTTLGVTRYYLTHRVMFVHSHGEIPEGQTIDHVCNRRACCNPDHLRALPLRDNVLRSETNPYVINARKELCIRGHEFTDVRRGSRYCAECARIRTAEYDARQRAKRRAS